MKITSDLWPCVGKAGLEVFATTADQRHQFGTKLFLATHFPIALRRFRPERPPETLAERDVLDQILTPSEGQRGNRVFVLYGAAGSGKSELMKWLQVMIADHDPTRAKFTVRVPRTELNVLTIAERFQHLLSNSYFKESTRQRWEEAQRKPRTLSKLLLLTALERSLDADAQINALYYRLLDWIHPHVAHSLDAMESADLDPDEPMRLLAREDLDELKAETSLSVPLNYEQFRHHLLTAFREHLMEGQYLPDTLGRIADDLARQGTRPILLVDDLVQSLNLFATDLLDYFITLGTGNWDVVLGLTPAALSADQRGQELLDRITHLDTVDDRVEKLWLSDIQGADSYFLTEETCAAFAGRYLAAYRELNGWSCEVCGERNRCTGLNSENKGQILAPFNESLLRRLFWGLPMGKGKARYFLRHLREVLAAVSNDEDFLTILRQCARVDTAVEADDEILATMAELYGPTAVSHRVILPADLMAAFGEAPEPARLSAELLQRQQTSSGSPFELRPTTDQGKVAIKAWLDGESVNRQSLVQLRKGIARWIRLMQPVGPLHAVGVARPHKVLQWRRVYLGVRPPILLEGVDEGEGIRATREIGIVAFSLHDFADASGEDRKALIATLAREERLLPLLPAAVDLHQEVRSELEEQLGMPVEEVALALYTWLVIAQGAPQERPPGFGESFWEQVIAMHTRFALWQEDPEEALCQSIRYLFDDFFGLRKNVYDGPSIEQVIGGRTPDAFLSRLMSVVADGVDRDYRLKNKPLPEVLRVVQQEIRRWRPPANGRDSLSDIASATLKILAEGGGQGVRLHQVPAEVFSELEHKRPSLYRKLWVTVRRRPED